jgi:hypothetical protein
MENSKNIIICYYHIEKTGGTSFRDYLYKLIKVKFPETNDSEIYYEESEILNDFDLLIKNYSFILNHVYYSDLLFNNSLYNITLLRKPIDRLISHYHFFDKKIFKYENLEEFKNKNFDSFEQYCSIIGNLYLLKFSNYYKNFSNKTLSENLNLLNELNENNNLIKEVIKTLEKFDCVLILENLKLNKINLLLDNNQTIEFSKLNINTNKFNYDENFLEYLNTYLKWDNMIYDHFLLLN